jgi:glutamate formiminotransferase / formiminotetrahydrofolate cyclodeaminase
MYPIVECVPNFSEGRDRGIIDQIVAEIDHLDDVVLLDVDPGQATNRTVVTLIGTPAGASEAAFLIVRKAAELIDMRKQKGEHARQGATDVVPFVPVSGISMEEVVELARATGKRIGEELGIPIYFYENAATSDDRRNLADVRRGEYEALARKLVDPRWKPDHGPAEFTEQVAFTGATQVSAREFLVAWNVNLNTTNKRKAHSIALRIREQGRFRINKDGKRWYDDDGNPEQIPGKFKNVKGVGWFIEEYGVAQISMNLTNFRESPMHLIYDEIRKEADERGLIVTGSELVGLLPKDALLAAGEHYLSKQKMCSGVNEKELLDVAIRSMGLNDLYPFDIKDKVIEYRVEGGGKQLADLTVSGFADELASDSPAPGGGSTAALAGALAAALTAMVGNLTYPKKQYLEVRPQMNDGSYQAQRIKEKLIRLIDEDTKAFNQVMAAFGLPKKTDQQKAARKQQIEAANQQATMKPLEMMRTIGELIPLLELMEKHGNSNSLSDVGVGALSALTCVRGAALNVAINLGGLEDADFVSAVSAEMQQLRQEIVEGAEAIATRIEKKLDE